MCGAKFGLACTTALCLLSFLAGCGGGLSSSSQTPRELALERTQLEQVAGELRAAEPDVAREVAASRRAWPLIFDGLPKVPAPPRYSTVPSPPRHSTVPQTPSPTFRSAVAAAGVAASPPSLPEAAFIARARTLTGPASGIAGIYESYEQLVRHGWLLTEQAVATIASGPTAVASFERANSSLYIDAIYDGHFNLSLLGKSLTSGYVKLGGPSAFRSALTQGQVNALASAYSIGAVRLVPHPSGAGEASRASKAK
jgi:hypothetical protein